MTSSRPDDPIDPLTAVHARLAAIEPENSEKPQGLLEVLDDQTDMDEVLDASDSVGLWFMFLRSEEPYEL